VEEGLGRLGLTGNHNYVSIDANGRIVDKP
jgi:hypothetical protein